MDCYVRSLPKVCKSSDAMTGINLGASILMAVLVAVQCMLHSLIFHRIISL